MAALPGVDWPAVQIAYVHGGATLSDLAAKHKIKPQTIRKRADREQWGTLRIQAEQKAIAAAAELAATRRVSDLLAFNSDDLKISRAIRAQLARRLMKADVEISPSELRMIASAAEAAQRMGRLALGASTDNFGHAGQGGEGPVAVTPVPMDAYLEARQKVLADY